MFNLFPQKKSVDEILEDSKPKINITAEWNELLKENIELKKGNKNWMNLYQEVVDKNNELLKEIKHLNYLKEKNVELIDRVNEIDSDVNRDLNDEILVLKNANALWKAKYQIIYNDYEKCAEQRDEFKHQLNAANKEIEALKSKVRDWEDKYAKSFSYRDMDKLQKTIDEQKKEIQKLKGDIVDYVIEKDDKLEEAKAIIEALKGMKTQGFEDYDSKDFVEQKHPMYPLHWGILQKAKDLTEGVEVDLNKPLDEQCDEEWKCPCNVCQKNRLDFHKEYDNL